MKAGKFLKAMVIGLGAASIIFFLITAGLLGERGIEDDQGGKIGRLDILGPIMASEETIEEIKQFREDDSISAIVIRIDSPGGAVTPSQEIYRELLRTREAGRIKVVASIGNLGASGGYYIASAAEKIFANPGSLVGSIGVLIELTKVGDLLDKIGIGSEVIKSGPFKDIGSPLRETTPEERKMLQGVIDDTHRQFVDAVVKGRGLDLDKVSSMADGRIFTGAQALGLDMIDELGGLEDAISAAALMAGIEGKPKIIKAKKKWRWGRLLEDFSARAMKMIPSAATPVLMYIWQP